MKLGVVISLAALASAGSGTLFGQGLIVWGNRFGTTTSGLRAPVFGVDPNDPFTPRTGNSPTGVPAGTQTYGGALLEGTGFTMGLFAGATPEAVRASLNHVDVLPFNSGAFAGFVGARGVAIPGAPGGTTVWLQFRAWDNLNGTVTSWSQVMANPDIARGASDEFLSFHLGGLDDFGALVPTPPTTQVCSFSLHLVVPEPSMVALNAFGFIILILLSRGRS